MYERDDMVLFVKMLERGLFPRGKDLVEPKVFKMEQCKEALDAAAEWTGIGRMVMIEPVVRRCPLVVRRVLKPSQ